MLTNAEEKNQHKKSTLNMTSIYKVHKEKQIPRHFPKHNYTKSSKAYSSYEPQVHPPPKKSIDFDYAPANNISQLISKGNNIFNY